MSGPGEERMQLELQELFDAAQAGELEPSDFAARLESLHARFLGAGANTPELLKRRADAVLAYRYLRSGVDLDRHHQLESLAQALGLPQSS